VAAPHDELIGITLGHCVIRAVLGQGGMASVYRAYQENLDREVAIKVLPAHFASDHAFVERFKLEARSMARLSHPNIVTVHDAGEDNSRLYIVMAYIPGGTLKQRMGRPMDLREVTHFIKDVAGALSYAHERGIIHRDVKPVNVLLDSDQRGVLSDFGIVKVMTASDNLTRVGAGVGTPEYMSPEQCRGGAVDARTDIYALGVMLYEMLTGRTPFVADNFTALAHAHIYEPVPPPAQLNPRISPAVQAVVLKALAKDPSQRFQQATDMALTLDQAVAAQAPMISSPVPPNPPGPPRPAQGYGPPAGRPLPPVYCPSCRQPNVPTQRFCSTCGLPLGTGGPIPHVPAGLASPQGAYTYCPRCRAPNFPGNRHCTACGQPLGLPGGGCRVCGTPRQPGQRFCTTCGQPLP
jgi:serine/threonine-protein kinase